MATVGVREGLFSTLMFGDNDEFETFLADDLADFRARFHSSPSHFSYLFLMGAEEEALIMAEEAATENSPVGQPTKPEFIEKLEDVRVEESGSVCSICLEDITIGSHVKRLECTHMYHGSCIGEWLKKTNTCPICRRQITPSS
ncbi:RING/U-box superfamily protein [Euphorbia peplus]|nr:RING/U-box superfamily protein [Euphorbia peplus]